MMIEIKTNYTSNIGWIYMTPELSGVPINFIKTHLAKLIRGAQFHTLRT